MKISTKGRYGLRALVDLVVYSKGNHISLVSIAERQNISSNYLEQVFTALRNAGIVKSIKGSQGGYILADLPENIKVDMIIRVLEGDFSIIDKSVFEDGIIDNMQLSLQKLIWDPVNEEVDRIFKNVSLLDLSNDYKNRNDQTQIMYYI
jgi:Rrf2 family transcriptional regulator, cysteine metabolism repressor